MTSTGRRSHASEEIESQPRCWEAAAELAGAAKGLLPEDGARVAAVGCGSSHHLAKVYARLREDAGRGETDHVVSSELGVSRRYDHVVLFSRTGTTSETLAALRSLPPGTPSTAVTAVPSSPLACEAGAAVLVEFADEQAVIQTRYVTSTLVLLRSVLGEDVAPLPTAGREALRAPLPPGALVAHQHVFLGRGWTVGLADEATLKLRETAQVWAESHQAMEYRHGPISLAEPGVLVWSIGPAPSGLADEVRATGASFVEHDRDPLAELVLAQRLAVALATSRRLDPDHPRHLARSIVLEERLLAP